LNEKKMTARLAPWPELGTKARAKAVDKEIHADRSRGAKVYPTDDLWICDNGAVFVFDKKENLTIVNWNFNGRGNRHPRALHNQVPLPIVFPALTIIRYLTRGRDQEISAIRRIE
jgi:agmatine/peptidylarginine deiminase